MNELKKGCMLQHGKYRIVRTLGRGSFGITYLAMTKVSLSGSLGHMDVTVNVAIKEFFMEEFNSRSRDGSNVDGTNASLFKNYRKKFYREAENLSKLRHPNIVRVLEVFDENNTTYYVMEYINGESLNDYIRDKGRIPEEEVLSFLKDIGEALQYMHDNKMLHLDLKPKNIMRNNDGHLFLIDFGLSKQYDKHGEPESSTTLGLGTPGYAPIEQENYKQDGTFPATLDIYALGATVYKMLVGSTPPHASDILSDGFPEELFKKIGVSSKTTNMVKKAMDPIKGQRFQSVSELVDYSRTVDGTVIVEHDLEVTYIEENEELLPIPDKGIFLEICNPTPGALSFQFYLNEEVCNTVFVYRDGKKIFDGDYLGGIRQEVVDALSQNGLLSKIHWERESSTTPLDGMTVSCTFLYKNGYKFARQVECAHPAYHHLLLDAIKNVFKVHELSQFINKALEKEFSYSWKDIENYGISIFSFMPNNELLIYHRGNIYFCNKIDFYGIRNYSQINATFDDIKYNLLKSDTPKIDFDSFLKKHKNKIENSFNIITYCRESDLLEILYKLRQNSSFCRRHRIIQEMQLLPLCHYNTKDEIVAYEYPHLYCETEFGGGIVDILQTGLIESKGDYTTETNIKKLSSFESIASLILSSIVQYHILEQSWEDEGLLLSIVPFDIKAEIWINKRYRDGFTLIERNTRIPCKKSEIISDDECTIVVSFLRKRFSIDVKELFGYKPNSIKLVVDVDTNTNIGFVFGDKELNKEIFMSQTEIFNYEEKI